MLQKDALGPAQLTVGTTWVGASQGGAARRAGPGRGGWGAEQAWLDPQDRQAARVADSPARRKQQERIRPADVGPDGFRNQFAAQAWGQEFTAPGNGDDHWATLNGKAEIMSDSTSRACRSRRF